MLEEAVAGLVRLNQQGIYTTFLGADTVLLHRGRVRVLDHLVSTFRHPYFRVMEDPSLNAQFYLPPEYVKAISVGRLVPEISIKSEFYSLGVLALMMMLGRARLEDLYCPMDKLLLQYRIKDALANVKYSAPLK